MDLFVVGSGLSRAASSSMPVVTDLLGPLTGFVRANRASALVGDQLPINDVEGWLDFLVTPQPFLSRPENLENEALFGRVADWLRQHLFDCQSYALGSPLPTWLRSLVETWHARQATVITLNYDTLIESTVATLTLTDHEGRRALPFHTLAVPLPFARSRLGGEMFARGPASTFSLVKLHGSLSWYYSGARGFGQPVFDVELQDVWSREQPTSVEEAARNARGLLPFIVPPAFAKVPYFENEVMRALWEFARSALESASNIYCIGYSLPAGDGPVRALLATYGAGKTVLPVNRDPAAAKHYKEMLPGSTVDGTYLGGDDIIKRWVADYTDQPAS